MVSLRQNSTIVRCICELQHDNKLYDRNCIVYYFYIDILGEIRSIFVKKKIIFKAIFRKVKIEKKQQNMKQIGNRVISTPLMYLSFQPKWNENIFFTYIFLRQKQFESIGKLKFESKQSFSTKIRQKKILRSNLRFKILTNHSIQKSAYKNSVRSENENSDGELINLI